MNAIDSLLGETVKVQEMTTTGDVAPVQVSGRKKLRGRPGRPTRPQRKKSTVETLLGEDDSIFPDDAKEIEVGQANDNIPMTAAAKEVANPTKQPTNPNYADGLPEPLMSPVVALVAPDVTPDAMVELDPTDVPQPIEPEPKFDISHSVDSDRNREVLNTILGKEIPNERPNPPVPVEVPRPTPPPSVANVENLMSQMGLQLPGNPLNEGDTGYNVVAAAATPGIPMPEHRASTQESISKVFNFARKFIK